MAGNKNSGRRDSLPRGGGRPRTRLIVHLPRPHMERMEQLASRYGVDLERLAQWALADYVIGQDKGEAGDTR